jgi:hypothetical protein
VTGPFVLYLAQGVTRMKLTQKLNFKPNCTIRGSCTLMTVANVLEPNDCRRQFRPRHRDWSRHPTLGHLRSQGQVDHADEVAEASASTSAEAKLLRIRIP